MSSEIGSGKNIRVSQLMVRQDMPSPSDEEKKLALRKDHLFHDIAE